MFSLQTALAGSLCLVLQATQHLTNFFLLLYAMPD